MFPTRLYYRIKPLIPRRVRLAVRRQFALRKRRRTQDVWPILPGSERPPEGWTGWPEGKQFAVVLTHDVEGPDGVAKCRQLMELEMKLGFRSSFNFIPEGGYRASQELREELTANGFEVGVHDLHHDGRLYQSREDFAKNAIRINQFLKEWGSVGFRSGFMLRRLDWLHDLNISYDASTFDTDPFEPQPEGTGTIFPFWVAAEQSREQKVESRDRLQQPDFSCQLSEFQLSGREGYVELPYTLPQDSTLFLLLRETSPEIWTKKLDWLAGRGAMALVNVHPDYISFDGKRSASRHYPAEHYAKLLQHIRERYGRSFWQPLPKELSAFVVERKLSAPAKPKRICMVTYSHFMSDARVTRYAEALATRGDHVDVIALSRSPDAPKQETFGNINLIRLQSRLGKKEKSPLAFAFPVVRFLISSSLWIARQHARSRYDLLHIHNIPDFLVFAAWYPKLTGARVVLDIHDIVPEFYSSKFKTRETSISIRALKVIERTSARFADHVIISNHLWRDKYAGRTGADGKCSVFINNVDSSIFQPRKRTRADDRIIVIFPGGLQWHQGLDIAIRAFRKVVSELPKAELHIYGDGNMKPRLVTLAEELGMPRSIRFFEPRPVRQIADLMANSDLGIVPKRADSFGNEAYSTKIMEFMSVGVPVVISSTKIDRYYFAESHVRFFESGNPDAMATAILEVLRDAGQRRRMVANGLEYAARNSWDSRKTDYLDLVDSLIGGRRYVEPDRSPAPLTAAKISIDTAPSEPKTEPSEQVITHP